MFVRTAKLQWGLWHKALNTIYEAAVVPILTYVAPIWVEAIRINENLTKYKIIQRIINFKITKAYRTNSYNACCVIAGLRAIQITIELNVHIYMSTKIKNLGCDALWEVRY